jgi:hypothetical protein
MDVLYDKDDYKATKKRPGNRGAFLIELDWVNGFPGRYAAKAAR